MPRQLLKAVFFTTLFYSAAIAQPAMTRTTQPALYTAISISGGATASTATGDNAFQDLIPIGFTFNYLGTNYTTIGVNTNGIAAFTGITASAVNTDLYSGTAPNTVLAPWWDDLEVVNGTGAILYQLQGTPGSRTFTIQWTDVHSYNTGSTALLNFQVVLFEGSNNIDFRYGAIPAGTFSAQESASIGIKSATGGNGEYIDAVTGSSFTGNAMLSASVTWPARRFRFSPGAPSPISGGNRTVGATGFYKSISEAVAEVNHRGLSAGLTLTLLDSLNDNTPANGNNFFPILIGPVAGSNTTASLAITSWPNLGRAIIRSPGSQSGVCVSQASSSVITTSSEPVIGLVGASFISVASVSIESSTAEVDRGISVLNGSPLLGTQYCGIQNVYIRLDRTNVNTIGIEQRLPSVPASAAGANSLNIYQDVIVTNSYAGILLEGDASFPDLSCTIGSSAPGVFSRIGEANADDIGNGSLPAYGIRAVNQEAIVINNNIVRNVSVTGAVSCDGIILEGGRGNCRIYNNSISYLTSHSVTATSGVTGIRASLHTTAGQQLHVYNNIIRTLSSDYTGTASAVRQVKGIWVQPSGGGSSAQTINVDFNTVQIDGGTSAASNTCFEVGTTTGPVLNVRNNIFSNITGAQSAPAAHYCWWSPTAGAAGNTGSVSNHNDFFLTNTTRGFAGGGGTTNYASLSAWQSAMGQDANSLAIDPLFISATNLHINEIMLNGAGVTVAQIFDDYDGDIRGTPPDIGADEILNVVYDVGVISLIAPGAGNCYSANQQVTVRVMNFGTSLLDFSTDTVWLTVNVSGSSTQTFNMAIGNNSLNNGNPLPPNGFINVPVGTINMSAAGVYNFDAYTSMPADPIHTNDTMSQAAVSFDAGTASSSSVSICEGSSVTLTAAGNTSSSIQWQQSMDGGVTWVNCTGTGNTSSPFTITPYGPVMFRMRMCGMLNTNAVSVAWNAIPPVTASASDAIICSGDTTTLTASSTQNYNYTWSPSGSLSSSTGATVMAWPASTTSYVVIADSANCSTRDTIEITVDTGPVLTLTVTDPEICPGGSDTIFITASGSYAYSWTSDPAGYTGTNDTIIVSPAMTTEYILSATDATSGCSSEYTATVTVDSLPVAAFSQSTSNGVVSFTNMSTSADTYLWDFGDSQTSTAEHPTHIYNISGAYNVILTATNSCGSDTASMLVPVIVGLAEADSPDYISVYPNPVSDYLTVILDDADEHVVVELFDALGHLVEQRDLQHVNAGSSFTMNVKGYEEGAYYLRVSSEHGVRTIRIMVLN